MNIELLRKAQASILDENNEFDMMDWRCCIAGHICSAAGKPVTLDALVNRSIDVGARALTLANAHGTGLGNLFAFRFNRVEAAAAIKHLIVQYSLCSPALEPAAQSRRARAGEQQQQEQQEQQEQQQTAASPAPVDPTNPQPLPEPEPEPEPEQGPCELELVGV